MAQKDTAKTWFEKGDKPTQAQFAQLFDWLIFSDQLISINQIDQLQTILQNKQDKGGDNSIERITLAGDGFYDLAENHILEKVAVLPSADANLKIGLTANGEELSPSIPVTVSDGAVIELNVLAIGVKRIFFTGTPADTNIYLFKKPLQ